MQICFFGNSEGMMRNFLKSSRKKYPTQISETVVSIRRNIGFRLTNNLGAVSHSQKTIKENENYT